MIATTVPKRTGPISPLRYPGGKGGLSSFLEDLLEFNELLGCDYYEPYAGGAGAALNLLNGNLVSSIHINDADPRVFAFWKSILKNTDRFVERIMSVPLDITEWRIQQQICATGKASNLFELGFSTFYMNRCNRSGVLKGSGPIGGYAQDGKWRLDVRFNREELAGRIQLISKLKDSIFVTGMDAIDFLKSKLPHGRARSKAFVYADPPYVFKAKQLYLNAYQAKDHACLARYLTQQKVLAWLVSYDDTQLIRELYGEHQIDSLPIRYSLQSKRTTQELLIAPQNIYLPSSNRAVRVSA